MFWKLRFHGDFAYDVFLLQWIFEFGVPPLRGSSAFDGALQFLRLRLLHRRAFRAVTTRLGFLSLHRWPRVSVSRSSKIGQRPLEGSVDGPSSISSTSVFVLYAFAGEFPGTEPPPREATQGGPVSISRRRVISFADSCHLLCSCVQFDEAMASLSSLF